MDLKKIRIKRIDGEFEDSAFEYKGLANFIFRKTQDIGELEFARELYKTGEVELTKENALILKTYIKECFGAVVHESLFPILDKEIDRQ